MTGSDASGAGSSEARQVAEEAAAVYHRVLATGKLKKIKKTL
jgi:hypothetical protein